MIAGNLPFVSDPQEQLLINQINGKIPWQIELTMTQRTNISRIWLILYATLAQ